MSEKSDFLKELYFHELDRKKSLESMVTLPCGIIAGLLGLVGYYFTKFNFNLPGKWETVLELAFLASASLAIVFLLLAVYWCARTVIGSKYEHLPGANTILTYWNDLESWHRKYLPKNSEEANRVDFDDFLTRSLAQCCQRNWSANHYRSEELFRTKRSIVWALIVVVILSICYYINFWTAPVNIRI